MKIKASLENQQVVVRPEALNDTRLLSVLVALLVFVSAALLSCHVQIKELRSMIIATHSRTFAR